MATSDESERGERLQKVLGAAGVASRRAAEELIRAGRVSVDGKVVAELGTRVGPRALITVDGRVVDRAERRVYYLLHKPVGYVSTASDPEGRPTVLDLVPRGTRVYPVGRLDYDSEGLIILTNDGALTQRLLHPSHEIEREYYALVVGPVLPAQLRQLRRVIELDGVPTAPAEVKVAEVGPDGVWVRFVIREGRNRQVRRMCAAVDLEILRLVRIRMGTLELGSLPEGQFRELRLEEVRALEGAAG